MLNMVFTSPLSFVQALHIIVPALLLVLAGVSFSLSVLLIPLLKLLPPAHTFPQFTHLINFGRTYLQTSAQLLAFSTLVTTFLTSQLADPIEAQKWKVWACALVALVAVAPYETVMIFPLNEKVEKLKGLVVERVEGEGELKKELGAILGRWGRLNFGRAGLAAFAGILGILGRVR
ncbi:hypothetical protein DM02DRAFT_733410 [Periconia macrospinosa]|uniref:DUF1772-domain-containing protein n=1 Tax=Periconia macrospinosa TaxID=97972 RepID=A0A2V1D4H3_9PLEO|nr:hypothetical protein DM02DRAFT_733410 [Periconia macrospinosa]